MSTEPAMAKPAPPCPLGHGELTLIYTDKPRRPQDVLGNDPELVVEHFHCSRCSVEVTRPAAPLTPPAV